MYGNVVVHREGRARQVVRTRKYCTSPERRSRARRIYWTSPGRARKDGCAIEKIGLHRREGRVHGNKIARGEVGRAWLLMWIVREDCEARERKQRTGVDVRPCLWIRDGALIP